MFCIHLFVDGFGAMSDGVVCVKCGLDKYPEALSTVSRLFGRVIRNDGTYGHRTNYPFVVKFPAQITFETDWGSWTHYFDLSGKLRRVA